MNSFFLFINAYLPNAVVQHISVAQYPSVEITLPKYLNWSTCSTCWPSILILTLWFPWREIQMIFVFLVLIFILYSFDASLILSISMEIGTVFVHTGISDVCVQKTYSDFSSTARHRCPSCYRHRSAANTGLPSGALATRSTISTQNTASRSRLAAQTLMCWSFSVEGWTATVQRRSCYWLWLPMSYRPVPGSTVPTVIRPSSLKTASTVTWSKLTHSRTYMLSSGVTILLIWTRFDLTPGFNLGWKNRDRRCKFPLKVQPGSLILSLNRRNLLLQNPVPALEISQIKPCSRSYSVLGRDPKREPPFCRPFSRWNWVS